MSDLPPQLVPEFYNISYNPGESLVRYLSIYSNDTTITFSDIQKFVDVKITQGILFGTRIGAAGLAIIILWMISKNRKTPIFIINQISLFLVLIHSSLYSSYLLSNYSSVTFNFTLFPQFIPLSDIHVFGATNLIQVLLVASIEISLVFQVCVIFKNDNYRKLGLILTIISSILGILTVAMYLTTAIKSMEIVYSDVLKTGDSYYFNIASILLASSVNFMTLLLSVKLFLAIRSRRFLGLKQFDSFHILLIMSTQTLICPSILFTLSYALTGRGTDTLPTIATLIVTLSLPLSSMWATSANNSSHPSSFSSYNQDSSSFKTNSPSFYSQGLNLSAKEKQSSILYDLYPTSHSSKQNPFDEYETDIEKSALDYSPVNEKHSQSDHAITLHTSSTLNCNKNHIEDKLKQIDDEIALYTPNTEAYEDARKFWCEETPKCSNFIGNDQR